MSIEEEVKNIKEQLADVSAKYRMMQSDYNARLKADLVAMLTEMQLQFEEKGCKDMRDCWWLLEEKIDKLKEDNHVDKT